MDNEQRKQYKQIRNIVDCLNKIGINTRVKEYDAYFVINMYTLQDGLKSLTVYKK